MGNLITVILSYNEFKKYKQQKEKNNFSYYRNGFFEEGSFLFSDSTKYKDL